MIVYYFIVYLMQHNYLFETLRMESIYVENNIWNTCNDILFDHFTDWKI